jgi:hypothetical protein
VATNRPKPQDAENGPLVCHGRPKNNRAASYKLRRTLGFFAILMDREERSPTAFIVEFLIFLVSPDGIEPSTL